ncbi:MAG: hypothetical protein ACK5HO_05325 [Pseudomonadota bacterium]|jgi:hypothetical protein
MNDAGQQKLLEQSAEDLWVAESRLGAVLHADSYLAHGVEDRDDLILWLSRDSLKTEEQEMFLGHAEGLVSVCEIDEIEYGVESQGRGFVVIRNGSTQGVLAGALSPITARNRFLMCLAIVSRIHDSGVACGNISDSSFSVDSFAVVRFVGLLGGYRDPQPTMISPELLRFIKPGDATPGEPSTAADVYALAVLGLMLFGVSIPLGAVDPARIDEYLKSVPAGAPSWVVSVLGVLVREPERGFCSDASAVIHAIAGRDAEWLEGLKQDDPTKLQGSRDEKALTLFEIQKLLGLQKGSDGRNKDIARQKRFILAAVAGFIACVAGLLSIDKAGQLGYLPRGKWGFEAANEETAMPLSAVMRSLGRLRGGGVHSLGSHPGGAGTALETHAKKSGAVTEGLQQGGVESGEAVGSLAEVNMAHDEELLSHISEGSVAPDEHPLVFELYDKLNQQSKALIAKAYVKSGGESERLFKDFLQKRSQRSALVGQSHPNEISTDAWFLASELRLTRQVAQEWGRAGALSPDELWWLAEILAKKRAPLFGYIAQEMVKRGIVPEPRAIFLGVAAEANETSGVPYEVLFRLTRDEPNLADVGVFTSWSGAESSRALFGVVLSSSQPEVIQGALSSLVDKPGTSELVRSVLEFLNAREDSQAVTLAPLIGALGLLGTTTEAVLENGLENLRTYPDKAEILTILLNNGSTELALEVLRVFGSEIHPGSIIPLLSRSEPRIKRAVIPLLSDVRVASLKASIREYYEAESDPELRRLFEQHLFTP